MAKFSSIAKGALGRREVTLTDVSGAPFSCAVRVLTGEDDTLVLAGARKHAEDNGVKDPKNGDPLYEQGKWILTILLGCVDSDIAERNEPFFDGGVSQIQQNLDRDRMLMLVEHQAKLQDDACPGPKGPVTPEQLAAYVLEASGLDESDELPFDRLPPNMRRSLWLSTVKHLAALYSSLANKSLSGSGSASDTTTSTTTNPESRKPTE